jgi:tol-pal system protein YbgF
MTPPFGTSVALRRGWSRGGGVFFVTTTLLLSAGCAMKGDVRRLQDEVAGQAARQEAQLRELSADIEALQDSLEAQSAIANEMVVDTRGGIARELRDIQTQLSQLTQLTGQIQRSVVLMSQRLQAEGAGVTTSPRRADPDSLRALLGRGGDPAAADQTYEAAVTQFNRGSLNTARMAFSRFLEDYPDHRLAPSAQFNLGDILFQENRLDEAIEEFLRVGQLYPTADRVPVALYRIGLIYVLQENVETARTYLERVVNSYPDSGVADLARDLLEDIR